MKIKTYMMVSRKIMKKTVKENFLTKMEIYMKANGKMIKKTV